MSKQEIEIKFVREAECEGEVMWDIVYNGESVGRITQSREDFALGSIRARGRKVCGYWVELDGRIKSVYIDTHSGKTSARVAFSRAKDYARSTIRLDEEALHLTANKELMMLHLNRK